MRRRTGSLLLEASLSVMVLTVALVGVAQLLAVAARQNREARWRAVATRELANVMERAMALSWEEMSDQRLAELQLSAEVDDALPAARLVKQLSSVEQPRPAKRLRLTIQYRNAAGRSIDPIALVAWKFQPGGER